jgi:hypothetical protein
MLSCDHPYRVRPDGAFEIDRARQHVIVMRRHAMRCDRKAPAAVKLLVLAAFLIMLGVVAARPAPAVQRSVAVAAGGASVPIPKFAPLCGTLVCELRNRRSLDHLLLWFPHRRAE